MNLPDCRTIAFEQGILAEPNLGPQPPRPLGARKPRREFPVLGAHRQCGSCRDRLRGRPLRHGGDRGAGQAAAARRARSAFQGPASIEQGPRFLASRRVILGAVRRATDRLATGLVARPGKPGRPRADSIGLAEREAIPEAEPEPLSGFRSGNTNEKPAASKRSRNRQKYRAARGNRPRLWSRRRAAPATARRKRRRSPTWE